MKRTEPTLANREDLRPGTLWRRKCNKMVCLCDEDPKVRFGVETVWLYRTDGKNTVYHLPVKTVLRRWEFAGNAQVDRAGRKVRP